MSVPLPERITRKQAKKQMSTIVFPLFLYSVCTLLLQYIPKYFETRIINLIGNIDLQMSVMILTIAVSILIAVIPVRISAAMLDLDIHAYLKKPDRLNIVRKFALVCIGISIWFGISALASGFRILLHSSAVSYNFLGHFTTKANILRNAVYILCFIIIKPVTEEYIFRAVAQRQFGHYSRFFGVMASSFLYALVQPSIADALCAFAFGWYLALITLRYHSIRPAVMIHISAALFSWFITVLPESWILLPTAMIVAVYGISISVLVTGAVKLNIVHPTGNEGMLWGLLLKVFPVILCIIIFIIASVLSLI